MEHLTFLGTGGGRFACILQVRATGGLYLRLSGNVPEPVHFHIDPGPGALVRLLARGYDPLKTDALLVSHCHPDHYGDAEILVEGMTAGGTKKRGALVASRSVLEGVGEFGPCVSGYHLKKPKLVRAVSPGDSVELSGIKVEATRVVHSDPASVGFRIHTQNGIIGYVSDTALDPCIAEDNRNSRVLVLPVTRPLNLRIPYHLDVEDAVAIAEAVKPELIFLNHFGMRVIKDGPEHAAEHIYRKTGIRTVAALDNMEARMGKSIEVAGTPDYDDV